MREEEIRALVREAIDRHLGRPSPSQTVQLPPPAVSRGAAPVPPPRTGVHASHVLLTVVPGSELDEGMCVIEPAVRCNHCGFCQSYGH